MTLLRTAFVAAFMALDINVPIFAEDTSHSTGPTEAATPAPAPMLAYA